MSPGRRLLIKLVQNYGADGVGARLGLSQTLLQRLLNGTVEIPDRLLLKAVDLLLDDERPEPPPLTTPLTSPARKQ